MKALFDTVDRLQVTLDYAKDRHAVLSSNVANLETPGYKPLDLAEPLPNQTANGSITSSDGSTAFGSAEGLTRTNALHLDASGNTAPIHGQVFERNAGAAGTDGNGVTLETEMAKIDENRIRYNTASELVSRRLALLRYASTDGQG